MGRTDGAKTDPSTHRRRLLYARVRLENLVREDPDRPEELPASGALTAEIAVRCAAKGRFVPSLLRAVQAHLDGDGAGALLLPAQRAVYQELAQMHPNTRPVSQFLAHAAVALADGVLLRDTGAWAWQFALDAALARCYLDQNACVKEVKFLEERALGLQYGRGTPLNLPNEPSTRDPD